MTDEEPLDQDEHDRILSLINDVIGDTEPEPEDEDGDDGD